MSVRGFSRCDEHGPQCLFQGDGRGSGAGHCACRAAERREQASSEASWTSGVSLTQVLYGALDQGIYLKPQPLKLVSGAG